jgi:UPF0716 protein FxsA
MGLGALLLIIPGFITDGLALFCLLPPVRARLADWLMARGFQLRPGEQPEQDGPLTIEGEFKRDE